MMHMQYDPQFGDAFWNSSKFGMVNYLLHMMSSWAIVCSVWYLPPMSRQVSNSTSTRIPNPLFASVVLVLKSFLNPSRVRPFPPRLGNQEPGLHERMQMHLLLVMSPQTSAWKTGKMARARQIVWSWRRGGFNIREKI